MESRKRGRPKGTPAGPYGEPTRVMRVPVSITLERLRQMFLEELKKHSGKKKAEKERPRA